MRFSQNEIEEQLSNAVPNGIKRDVARETGIYESVVYAWFNHNDERKSPQFKTLQVQCALDNLNPDIGEAHWQVMNGLREANRPATQSGLCVKTETAKTNKETSDLVSKVLTDAPLYEQLTEALEIRDQAERNVRAILEALNSEKENGGRTRLGNYGGPIDLKVRQITHEKVESRRVR